MCTESESPFSNSTDDIAVQLWNVFSLKRSKQNNNLLSWDYPATREIRTTGETRSSRRLTTFLFGHDERPGERLVLSTIKVKREETAETGSRTTTKQCRDCVDAL